MLVGLESLVLALLETVGESGEREMINVSFVVCVEVTVECSSDLNELDESGVERR